MDDNKPTTHTSTASTSTPTSTPITSTLIIPTTDPISVMLDRGRSEASLSDPQVSTNFDQGSKFKETRFVFVNEDKAEFNIPRDSIRFSEFLSVYCESAESEDILMLKQLEYVAGYSPDPVLINTTPLLRYIEEYLNMWGGYDTDDYLEGTMEDIRDTLDEKDYKFLLKYIKEQTRPVAETKEVRDFVDNLDNLLPIPQFFITPAKENISREILNKGAKLAALDRLLSQAKDYLRMRGLTRKIYVAMQFIIKEDIDMEMNPICMSSMLSSISIAMNNFTPSAIASYEFMADAKANKDEFKRLASDYSKIVKVINMLFTNDDECSLLESLKNNDVRNLPILIDRIKSSISAVDYDKEQIRKILEDFFATHTSDPPTELADPPTDLSDLPTDLTN